LIGAEDALCLRAAANDNLTFVTYDRRTIAPLLYSWAEEGVHHNGVILVTQKAIPQGDVSRLVSALSNLAEIATEWDWVDRTYYLRP
jgi:hypothetical protein